VFGRVGGGSGGGATPGLEAASLIRLAGQKGSQIKGNAAHNSVKKATGAAHKMRAVAFVLAAAAPYRASALLDHGARRALRGRRLRGATFGLVTRTSPSDANAMYYPQQSYGKSVAIDGDIAVVGAPGDSNEKGAAYVLRTTDGGATYVELAKLTASDRYSVAGEHRFGWSVAIDGNTIVVGACVEIKILRRVRAEASRRPPRHRRDACSMAWRCEFLTARPRQHGCVISKK
jgi:hypothetical protein